MRVFLGLHAPENLGRGRISVAQAVRKISVDAAVFLFERDCEREDFALGELIEVLGHAL